MSKSKNAAKKLEEQTLLDKLPDSEITSNLLFYETGLAAGAEYEVK